MTRRYLLIASEDPIEFPVTRRAGELALGLKSRGHAVELFLVQNAVLACRAEATSAFAPVLAASIDVLADDFSLRERGIELDSLAAGIAVAPIDVVVRRLANGWIVLWS